MKQFNSNNLRSFVDRVKANRAGKHIVDHSEMSAVALDLADLLLYMRELEEKVNELNKKIAEDAITIELKGEKF